MKKLEPVEIENTFQKQPPEAVTETCFSDLRSTDLIQTL